MRNKEKLKFPRISILAAVKIIEDVRKKYGADILPYSEFARIIGAKAPRGGKYGLTTEALKLYGLMDRHSFSEIAILDEGKKILNSQIEEEKKRLMLQRILGIPVLAKLYQRFKDGLPKKRKPVTDYLVNVQKIEKGRAGRIAGIFNKDYPFFKDILSSTKIVMISEDIKGKEMTGSTTFSKPEKVTELGIYQKMYKMVRIMGYLFPPDNSGDINKLLQETIEIADSLYYAELAGMLKLFIKLSGDKTEEQLRAELKKLEPEIFDILKKYSIELEESN
ncbi:MAG: hypothetical protein HY051_01250 [Candidatus Aenigmarchaeota archaeon]|nr:hypothetical protein [Candidatus Aenigmarchaeota archaeon]